MIDAECLSCGAQGPHHVIHDDGWSVTAVCTDCGCTMHVVLYDVNTPVPEQQRSQMTAIQTYTARNIRAGYRAHNKECVGEVQAVPEPGAPGTVTLVVQCTVHGKLEVWKDIPAHSAVHAYAPERQTAQ